MTRRLGLAVVAAGLGLALFLGGFLAACGAAGEEPQSSATSTSTILQTGELPVTFGSATAASPRPPSGLSRRGRVLWQFEALLHDRFGTGDVCSSGRWRVNFTGGPIASYACSPLAVYSPYFYVFAQARHTAFHISKKKEVGGFGNYPEPVLIRGRPIACNTRETQFLIEYPDAISFTVDCSRAGYVIP